MIRAQRTPMYTYNTDKIHVARTGSAIQANQHQIIIQKTQNIVTNTKKYTRKAGKKHAQQDKHTKMTTTHTTTTSYITCQAIYSTHRLQYIRFVYNEKVIQQIKAREKGPT